MKITPTRCLHLAATVMCTNAFMLSPYSIPLIFNGLHSAMSSTSGEEGSQQSPQKNLENIMETASLSGAEEVAKLDIQERTKRAMLAEQVEDRIFELVEEVEEMVKHNNGVLEGDAKEEAVELAKQTKALQIQYDDLVNGRPSSLLELGMGK